MKNCPNCNRSIEGFHLDCPYCGYQLVTPDKAQEALAELDRIQNFMLNLDMSPEGISKTSVYIDNVTSFIQIYQELLLQFMEEHKQVCFTCPLWLPPATTLSSATNTSTC